MEGVASRFACLKDDDSTDWVQPKTKNKRNKNLTNGSTNGSKPGGEKPKKKNQLNNEAKELQQLAFQTSSKKSKNKSKSKGDTVTSNASSKKEEKQYEAWKEKDEELVKDAFSHDIEQAILLSKVDFEEQKATQKIIDEERQRLQMLESAKKPKKLSLDQFNQLEPQEIEDISSGAMSLQAEGRPVQVQYHSGQNEKFPSVINEKQVPSNRSPVKDVQVINSEDFFQKVQSDAKQAVNREHLQNSFRNMSVTKNGVPLNQSALMEQFKATVEQKDKEIAQLKSENESLSSELLKVKKRYKTIRTILDQAEVKETAEVIVQAEKLRKDQVEMSENITQLTEELEQTKTRNQLLSKELRILQEKRPRRNSQGGSHTTSEKN